ncbi:MAG: hypothetical protein H0U53_11025 [Actinobacteria bacterium]|nr:hypothetical protein [Actinomycetota bacterium]
MSDIHAREGGNPAQLPPFPEELRTYTVEIRMEVQAKNRGEANYIARVKTRCEGKVISIFNDMGMRV